AAELALRGLPDLREPPPVLAVPTVLGTHGRAGGKVGGRPCPMRDTVATLAWVHGGMPDDPEAHLLVCGVVAHPPARGCSRPCSVLRRLSGQQLRAVSLQLSAALESVCPYFLLLACHAGAAPALLDAYLRV